MDCMLSDMLNRLRRITSASSEMFLAENILNVLGSCKEALAMIKHF
jgi:hypothetical protein